MDAETIRRLVAELDTTRATSAEKAWAELRGLGPAVAPWLLEAFPRFRTWQGRVGLVFHSIRHARTSEEAFRLGALGCRDRSYMVRYRACGLLAYSQRTDAIAHVTPLLSHKDGRTVEDALAAIDAIESRNHHYFVDRDHSGRVHWCVNDDDG